MVDYLSGMSPNFMSWTDRVTRPLGGLGSIQGYADDADANLNAHGTPVIGVEIRAAIDAARIIAVRTAEAKARDFERLHAGSECSCRLNV